MILKILQNENDIFWLINGKIKPKLSLNSKLRDLAKYLTKMYKINRSDYGPLKFLLNDEIYENFELALTDIGIQNKFFINVEFETFPTNPIGYCTREDRDNEFKDGILFKLVLHNKLKFMIEKCLADTSKTGTYFREIIEYILAGTDHPIEISIIHEKIEEMKYLTQSYLVGIQKILKKLFLI